MPKFEQPTITEKEKVTLDDEGKLYKRDYDEDLS